MKKSAMRLDRLVSVALIHPATRFIPVPSEPRVPILMYHGIRRELGRRGPYFETNTSPEVFAAHMRFLKRNEYETVTPGEALAYVTGKADGRKRVAVTFDDGYSDFYTNAFPVLSGLGLQATMFVVSGFAQSGVAHSGATCMDWKQIKEIQDHGIEIGSHTATHPELWRLSRPALEQEIAHSKDTIAERLGTSVRSFSHPFAFPEENRPYVEGLAALLRQHGYESGVSTVIGTASARHSRYVLPRIPVNSHDDLPLFRAKLEGAYDWLHVAQRLYKGYVKRPRPPVTVMGSQQGGAR